MRLIEHTCRPREARRCPPHLGTRDGISAQRLGVTLNGKITNKTTKMQERWYRAPKGLCLQIKGQNEGADCHLVPPQRGHAPHGASPFFLTTLQMFAKGHESHLVDSGASRINAGRHGVCPPRGEPPGSQPLSGNVSGVPSCTPASVAVHLTPSVTRALHRRGRE